MKRSVSLPPTLTRSSSCSSSTTPSQQKKRKKMSIRRQENETEWPEDSDVVLLELFIQLCEKHPARDFKALGLWNMATEKLNNLLNQRDLPNTPQKTVEVMGRRLQHLKGLRAKDSGSRLKNLLFTLFYEYQNVFTIPTLITKMFSRDRSRSPTRTTTAPSVGEGPSSFRVSGSISSGVPPPSDKPKYDNKLNNEFWSLLRHKLNIDPVTTVKLMGKTETYQKDLLITMDDIKDQLELVETLKVLLQI